MAKQIAKIKLTNIDKILLYVTNCKKTMSQTYAELQGKYSNRVIYLLNGGMWNPDGTPCAGFKANGKLLSGTPWGNIPGYGWDNPSNLCMTLEWQKYTNYIACSHLIQNGVKVNIPYGTAQGGARGRTGIGLDNQGNFVLYCSQDGSSDRKTPEGLQSEMASLGCQSAIMLDSGGSSMCNFNGLKITGDGRRVHNWIVVVMKQETKNEEEKDPPMTDTGNKIIQKYITANPCYTGQSKKTKTKMMLHSTGIPGGTAAAVRNSMNSANASISVEFVLDNTGIYQLLPLGIKSWHCGYASKDKINLTANNTHIACEVCEPVQTRLLDINWYPLRRNGVNNTTWAVTRLQKELIAWGYNPNGVDGNFGPGCETAVKAFQRDNGLTVDGSVGLTTKAKFATRAGSYLKYDPNDSEVKAYFDNVYAKSVWLFATILKQVGGKASEIVSHAEGYQLGIASNHADVGHWFPLHGKTMDVFRADVEKAMNGKVIEDDKKEDNMTNVDAPAAWAAEAWEKASKKVGIDGKTIMDGTRPTDNITRQEIAVALNRLSLLD